MQITTRGRYAVMAMVDLASREAADCACGPVCLAEIAARQQLSQAYLEQLFGKLRRAALVCSSRGPGGGYRLARPSSTIGIAEIVAAVDEPIKATRCTAESGGCPAAAPGGIGRSAPPTPHSRGSGVNLSATATQYGVKCQTHDLWSELGRQIALFLDGITLADVVRGQVVGRAVSVAAKASHWQDAD